MCLRVRLTDLDTEVPILVQQSHKLMLKSDLEKLCNNHSSLA